MTKTPTARTTMTSFFDTTTNLWSDAFLAGRVVVCNDDDAGNNDGRGEGLLMTTTATTTTTTTMANDDNKKDTIVSDSKDSDDLIFEHNKQPVVRCISGREDGWVQQR